MELSDVLLLISHCQAQGEGIERLVELRSHDFDVLWALVFGVPTNAVGNGLGEKLDIAICTVLDLDGLNTFR